jgi:peptidoglycan/LPS O-acetylase OafA/YrhL
VSGLETNSIRQTASGELQSTFDNCAPLFRDAASDNRMIANDGSWAFRSDIEGLRGIAILIVVLFHCGVPGVSGGFIGVDVFFVLSGYLITGLLVAEAQKTSELSLLHFYARRVRRLLPASALTLVVTLLIGAIILAPQELDSTGHAGRATALYISNIFFDKNAGDYFAPDVKANPMLHTWSLAVEEQFYLFWPLLVLLSLVWLRSLKALVIVLCGLTVISLGIGVWCTANSGTFAFYELPARAWEFGIGGLAVLLPRGTLMIPFGWWPAIGWLGILGILGSSHLIEGDAGFPGWVALIPVMGTAVVLIAGREHSHRGVGVMLDSAVLQALGKLSYSWYLWHWPFLVFAAALLPNISLAGKITAAGASLGVAAISYYFVENPIRYHSSLLRRPVLSVGLAGVLTVCSLGAALLSMWFATQLAKEPEMKSITAAIAGNIALPRQQCVSQKQSSDVKMCQFGDTSSSINIVLLGDSHAIQWFNPLQRIAESNGWKLTTVVRYGCTAFNLVQPGTRVGERAACARWRDEALKKIVDLRPSIVFIGNATSELGRKDTLAMGFSLDELQTGTRRTLETLSAAGIRIVVMRDNPSFTYNIPICLARSARHSWYPGGSCEADRSQVLNPAVFESEKAGAQGLSNVHFIDITERLCQKDICRPVQGDALLYQDSHHLTANFTQSLIALLEAELHAVLNAPGYLAAAR